MATPEQQHTPAVYTLTAVSKVYGRGSTQVRALSDISLEVSDGEFLAIVGASGSGKTTLLQLLGALDRPSEGTISLLGRDFSAISERDLTILRRDTIGFVFQQFNLIPTLSAADNIEVALAVKSLSASARKARVVELLSEVGLSARSQHLPSQLSGGEQQRVAIARALANRPAVLLADEPTGNLDSGTGAEILALLKRLAADEKQTIILITHEDTIAEAAQRIIHLQDGHVVVSA
jgi:putative ABC transport system ATP-binding protein